MYLCSSAQSPKISRVSVTSRTAKRALVAHVHTIYRIGMAPNKTSGLHFWITLYIYKQAVVRDTTNPAPCCHLANDTDLLTPVVWAVADDNKQIDLWPELTRNLIRSSHGHSTPSLKISCKSVQPFSRNVADKETKKPPENNTPSPYRGRGNKLLCNCSANTTYRILRTFDGSSLGYRNSPGTTVCRLQPTMSSLAEYTMPLNVSHFVTSRILPPARWRKHRWCHELQKQQIMRFT